MADTKQPMQPIEWVGDVIRFRKNAVVRHLLDWATERGMGLNELAVMNFNNNDFSQLAQLIGYSVSGYGDLSYAVNVEEADRIAAKLAKAKKGKRK